MGRRNDTTWISHFSRQNVLAWPWMKWYSSTHISIPNSRLYLPTVLVVHGTLSLSGKKNDLHTGSDPANQLFEEESGSLTEVNPPSLSEAGEYLFCFKGYVQDLGCLLPAHTDSPHFHTWFSVQLERWVLVSTCPVLKEAPSVIVEAKVFNSMVCSQTQAQGRQATLNTSTQLHYLSTRNEWLMKSFSKTNKPPLSHATHYSLSKQPLQDTIEVGQRREGLYLM